MAFSLKRLGFVGLAGLLLLMGAQVVVGGQAFADAKKPGAAHRPGPVACDGRSAWPHSCRFDSDPK